MIRNIIIVVLAAVVILLVFYPKDVPTSESVTPESREYVDLKVGDVNKKIDEKGFEHAVIDEVENVVKSVKQLDTSARRELDSVKALLQIKDKQLKQYLSYSATVRDTVLVPVRIGDSLRYSDKWANIEYVHPKDAVGTGYFNFSYNADISYAEYWRKKHFLAPKRHYIDFWISDPRATINGVKRVKFEAKEPKARVEVNAIGLYDNGLNLGVDGQIRLGRIRIGGGYLYDLDRNVWRPIVTSRFNLLEF